MMGADEPWVEPSGQPELTARTERTSLAVPSTGPVGKPMGWYVHPSQPGLRHLWDGQKWTGHVAPVSEEPPAQGPVPAEPGRLDAPPPPIERRELPVAAVWHQGAVDDEPLRQSDESPWTEQLDLPPAHFMPTYLPVPSGQGVQRHTDRPRARLGDLSEALTLKRMVLGLCALLLLAGVGATAALAAGGTPGPHRSTPTTQPASSASSGRQSNTTVPISPTTELSPTAKAAINEWVDEYVGPVSTPINTQLSSCSSSAARISFAYQGGAPGQDFSTSANITNCKQALTDEQAASSDPPPPTSSAQQDWQAYLQDVTAAANSFIQYMHSPADLNLESRASSEQAQATSELDSLEAIAGS